MEDRSQLESLALKEVCACRYYDLADTAGETPEEDFKGNYPAHQ
ncbi:MAG: hypothetical protein QG562_465 [Patescibacteria group bacterium]|nr:hypothetical protein [Patescibacteria group bacterium]